MDISRSSFQEILDNKKIFFFSPGRLKSTRGFSAGPFPAQGCGKCHAIAKEVESTVPDFTEPRSAFRR